MTMFRKVGLTLLVVITTFIGFRYLTVMTPEMVGAERNSFRENLGIPLVSKDWDCKQVSPNYFLCSGHDSIGHVGKEVKFLRKEVLVEKDTYILSCSEELARRVIVENHFSPDTLTRVWTENDLFERSEIPLNEFRKLIDEWEECISSYNDEPQDG